MHSASFITVFLQFFFVVLGFAATVPKLPIRATSSAAASATTLPQGTLNSNETSAAFPLPKPSITLDMRVAIDIYPVIDVGTGPYGDRVWIPFQGGRWTATWGSGTVRAGGEDAQLVTENLSHRIDTRYLLITDDETPAYIYIYTSGWLTGPVDVLTELANPATANNVKPTQYTDRLYVNMETGDSRYSFVNTAMWLASSSRRSNVVVFDGYRIK
ncbi:hypothetical protein RUND412_009285 [Rhizina undulata]